MTKLPPNRGHVIDCWIAVAQTKVVASLRDAFAKGVDIDQPLDEAENTALHTACREGWLEGVEFLLQAGANPARRNKHGYTPLHSAAQSGQGPLVELLLAQGVDPKAVSDVGYAPLHVAAMASCGDAVRTLLAAGCNPLEGCASDEFVTPVALAAELGREDAVVAFMEASAQVSALLQSDDFWNDLKSHRKGSMNPQSRIDRVRRTVAAHATSATIDAAMPDRETVVAPARAQGGLSPL